LPFFLMPAAMPAARNPWGRAGWVVIGGILMQKAGQN